MKRWRMAMASVACGCAVALVGTAARAELAVKSSLAERVRQADYVITGTVTDTTSTMMRVKGFRYISTAVRLHVDRYLKAPAGERASPDITLRVPGGQVGDLTMRVSDMTAFHRGDRVVLLLKESSKSDVCQLVNGRSGAYPITIDPNTGQDIVLVGAESSLPGPMSPARTALAVTAAAQEAGVPLQTFLGQLDGLIRDTH